MNYEHDSNDYSDADDAITLHDGQDMTEYNNEPEPDEEEMDRDDCDESMDGDFDSAMASAGFGTDEDYGVYNDPIEFDGYFD